MITLSRNNNDNRKLQELIIKNQLKTIINDFQNEIFEQSLIASFLPPNSNVLELGGRTGTVSCLINKIIKKKQNHLVIEPNVSFKNHLTQLSTQFGFQFFNGFISNKPIWAEVWNHSTKQKKMTDTLEILRTIEMTDEQQEPNKWAKHHRIIKLTNYKTITELQQEYGFQFDTIVADCEGALPQIFNECPILYEQIKCIILEWDSNVKESDKFRQKLMEHNFKSIFTYSTGMAPKWCVDKGLYGTSNSIGHEVLYK